jgi:hypothetical protein
MMTDPIAAMLTTIRNANQLRYDTVLPCSFEHDEGGNRQRFFLKKVLFSITKFSARRKKI